MRRSKVEQLAKELFGDMKSCSKEENKAINKYIGSISNFIVGEDGKPINFYGLINKK